MKKTFTALGVLLCSLALILSATSCGSTAVVESTSSQQSSAAVQTDSLALSSDVSQDDLTFSDRDLDGTWDDSTATHITLSDAGISVDGSGAAVSGDVLTINAAGTYVLTGSLTNGQIVVSAPSEDKVQIVLNGAEIQCADSAAIYIEQADKVFLTAADGTKNTLSSGDTVSAAAEAEGIDGVIYSKDDLTINGTGALTVNGTYKHGIVSKDNLVLAGVSLTVTAVSDGLRGKDCVKIASGTYVVNAGSDGIQSNNDEDTTKGFIYIAGGDFTITAANDGVQAETLLCVTDGKFQISSGGGSANASTKSDGTPNGGWGNWGKDTTAADTTASTTAETEDAVSDSAKGLKAGVALVLAGGSATIDSSDDSVHCNGDISIREGCTLSLSSGDDGVHADSTLDISGGDITVSKSYEGLEGLNVTVSGGNISVTSSDDGLNAAGGSDTASAGRLGQNAFNTDSGDTPLITISGGYLYVNASGDGLDSNGNLIVTGGEIYVDGPTNSGNGALDYGDQGYSATISGGTIVAAGASGMAVGFGDSSSQCSLLISFDNTISGGTAITVTDADGNTVLSYTPAKDYQCAVLSSPDLKDGSTYTVTAGDNSTEVTLSGVSTTSGTQNSRGGMGGGQSQGGGMMPGGGNRPSGGGPSGGTPPSGDMGTGGGPQNSTTGNGDTTQSNSGNTTSNS